MLCFLQPSIKSRLFYKQGQLCVLKAGTKHLWLQKLEESTHKPTVSKLLQFHFLHITLIKQNAACRSRFPNIRDKVIHTTDRSCSVSGLSLECLLFLEAGRALLSFSIEALAAETHNIVTHPYFCMAKQLIMPVSKYVYMHMLWGIQYWNLFIKKKKKI